MARTRLGEIVARAFRVVRGARARGIPVLEHYEEASLRRRANAIGRREMMLGASSALLAACGTRALRSPPDEAPSSANDAAPPIVLEGVVGIVGGGIAGVNCAYLLKQAGVMATLFEGQNRLGGRMFTDRMSFADPDGQHCELGGELIDADHQTMLSLCYDLGIPLLDYETDTPGLAEILIHVGGQALTMQDILNGLGPICDQVMAAIGALADGGNTAPTYTNPNGGGPVDGMSIKAWMDSFGFTGPVRTVLEETYITEMGLDTDQQSAWNLIWDIADTSNCDPFDDPSVDERYTTATGNDAVPTRLAAMLDPGQVKTGYQLVAIAENPDGRITLTFDVGSSVATGVFEHVVLALPFTMLRKVDMSRVTMPAVKTICIQTLGYGTGAKLMTGFSSRPWRTPPSGAPYPPSSGGTTTDLTNMQYTWETSRKQPGASGIITSFFGGTPGVAVGQGTPESQSATFLASFDTVFPGASAAANGNVSRMHWPSFKWNQGSYACYLVGQWTTISGAEVQRVGNIHFAGEHTAVAQGTNGFMEGGASSGAVAASEVLVDLGVMHPDAGMTDGSVGMRVLPPATARRMLARANAIRRRGALALGPTRGTRSRRAA
jgi:monoamine oxidase